MEVPNKDKEVIRIYCTEDTDDYIALDEAGWLKVKETKRVSMVRLDRYNKIKLAMALLESEGVEYDFW